VTTSQWVVSAIFGLIFLAVTAVELLSVPRRLEAGEREAWTKTRAHGLVWFLVTRSWPGGVGFLLGDVLNGAIKGHQISWSSALTSGLEGLLCFGWWLALRWRRTERSYQLTLSEKPLGLA
jgi:hypothetical protein